ncbi:MAG: uroporphyrinogen decarboxylase family protein [Armatimonadota bacterium]
MTSKERVLCAFQRGTPDRIPVSPQHFGRIPQDSDLAFELVRETDIMLYAGWACDCFIGSALPRETETIGNITRTIYHTPNGDLTRVVTPTPVTSACTEFPCKNADDVLKLLSAPYEPPTEDAVQASLHHFFRTKEWLGDEGVVLFELPNAICFPAEWLSPQDFCLLWADAPEVMGEMVRVGNERLLAFVERVCQAGVDVFRIVGGEYASTQLGPVAYDRLVRRYDKELVALIHHYGAIAYFHNHGPIMRYLDAIVDIGVDALDPLEAPPWGDCDMPKAKDILRGRVCIVGNIDDMEVMGRLSTEEILAIGEKLIQQAGPDGFVLSGTASGTYGEHAARNFIALAKYVAKECV